MVSRKGMKMQAAAGAMLAVLVLGGCAQGLGGGTYSRTEARRAMTVQFGTIESVRAVQLEGTKTPVGSVAGAAVGGIAGSTIGGGRGQAVATVIGAVVGGVAGAAVEEGTTRTPGVADVTEDPERARRMLGQYVIRRFGEPEDIANMALFLASDAASWITGQTYPVYDVGIPYPL